MVIDTVVLNEANVDVLEHDIENVIHRKSKHAHIINRYGRELIECCKSQVLLFTMVEQVRTKAILQHIKVL